MGVLVVVISLVLHTWGLVVVVVETLYQYSEGLNHCTNIPLVAAILALCINWVSTHLCIVIVLTVLSNIRQSSSSPSSSDSSVVAATVSDQGIEV